MGAATCERCAEMAKRAEAEGKIGYTMCADCYLQDLQSFAAKLKTDFGGVEIHGVTEGSFFEPIVVSAATCGVAQDAGHHFDIGGFVGSEARALLYDLDDDDLPLPPALFHYDGAIEDYVARGPRIASVCTATITVTGPAVSEEVVREVAEAFDARSRDLGLTTDKLHYVGEDWHAEPHGDRRPRNAAPEWRTATDYPAAPAPGCGADAAMQRLAERAAALRHAWGGKTPIMLDDEIDGLTLRWLLELDDYATRETGHGPNARRVFTPAQRAAVSAYRSAELRARLVAGPSADAAAWRKERDEERRRRAREHVVLDCAAEL